MLGHSSIVTTADTYTSVLPETAHRAAQATADMIIQAARCVPGSRLGASAGPTPASPLLTAATARCELLPSSNPLGAALPGLTHRLSGLAGAARA